MTGRRDRDGLLPGTAPANVLQRPETEQAPEGAPAIGEIVAGKYRIERVLGAGGMGVVVAARHLNLDTLVAIKFLLPGTLKNANAVTRFTREARAAVRITNEHVARVLDVGSLENGSPYIVMEFLEGTDLATRLKHLRQLSIEEAVESVLQACEALSEAHGLGIVHRDLKPANLFCIRRLDGLPWIKVVDFGISKFVDDNPSSSQIAVTQSSVVMGSPAYMSPEQMQSSRDVDARSDIWALGIILFELLTGRQPFDGESFAEVVLQVNIQRAPSVRGLRGDCPEGLEQVIFRCLERDREKRFGDVAALAIALLPFGPERAKVSVERIARTTQGGGSSSMTMTGQGFVPMRGSSPGAPVLTLTALGHTTGERRRRPGSSALLLGAAVTLLAALAGAFVLLRPRTTPAFFATPPSATPQGVDAVSPAAVRPESTLAPVPVATPDAGREQVDLAPLPEHRSSDKPAVKPEAPDHPTRAKPPGTATRLVPPDASKPQKARNDDVY